MNAKIKTLIVCGALFDSYTGAVTEDMAILTEGNRIAEVAPLRSFIRRAELSEDAAEGIVRVAHALGAELIDLSSAFVMPGLIDGRFR